MLGMMWNDFLASGGLDTQRDRRLESVSCMPTVCV